MPPRELTGKRAHGDLSVSAKGSALRAPVSRVSWTWRPGAPPVSSSPHIHGGDAGQVRRVDPPAVRCVEAAKALSARLRIGPSRRGIRR